MESSLWVRKHNGRLGTHSSAVGSVLCEGYSWGADMRQSPRCSERGQRRTLRDSRQCPLPRISRTSSNQSFGGYVHSLSFRQKCTFVLFDCLSSRSLSERQSNRTRLASCQVREKGFLVHSCLFSVEMELNGHQPRRNSSARVRRYACVCIASRAYQIRIMAFRVSHTWA